MEAGTTDLSCLTKRELYAWLQQGAAAGAAQPAKALLTIEPDLPGS
jgi:hypothetical protein